MIKLGICNELFEGWDFAQVCRTVKAIGFDGIEIAPFTLAPTIFDLKGPQRRELKAIVEDAGLETIGLHWLLAKTESYYLTSPDRSVRDSTANYLRALAEATRDLGGSLMVLGSPKQRDLLPGVTYDQAVDYAIDVFEGCPARAGFLRGRPLPGAAGAQRDELPQYLRPGDGASSDGSTTLGSGCTWTSRRRAASRGRRSPTSSAATPLGPAISTRRT